MKSSIFICPAILLLLLFNGCKEKENLNLESSNTPFVWENANMYFLLTDRFNNGDKTNDINFNRTKETAVLRGFKGGDFAGVTQKINEGYFTKLGINALWFSLSLNKFTELQMKELETLTDFMAIGPKIGPLLNLILAQKQHLELWWRQLMQMVLES